MGRLVIPLSDFSDEVVGVDVSEAMMTEAQKNCTSRNINNCKFILSDDTISKVTGKFDFINSFITFQHIHIKKGEKIIKKMLELLNSNGVGAIHVTYAVVDKRTYIMNRIMHNSMLSKMLLIKNGKNPFMPVAEINCYNLNRIMQLLQSNNCTSVTCEFVNHGGNLGTILYFKKN